MTQPEDDSLREAFRTMARHDARRAPEFRALLARVARATPRPTWHKVVPVASALALAACVLLGLQVSSRQSDSAVSAVAPAAAPAAAPTTELAAPALAANDPAPLDFLLTLPGSSALSSVPAFDTRTDFPLPGRTR